MLHRSVDCHGNDAGADVRNVQEDSARVRRCN